MHSDIAPFEMKQGYLKLKKERKKVQQNRTR